MGKMMKKIYSLVFAGLLASASMVGSNELRVEDAWGGLSAKLKVAGGGDGYAATEKLGSVLDELKRPL